MTPQLKVKKTVNETNKQDRNTTKTNKTNFRKGVRKKNKNF